ncbi:hypothetical protein BDR22DRAFT_482327 [Usnea florida]
MNRLFLHRIRICLGSRGRCVRWLCMVCYFMVIILRGKSVLYYDARDEQEEKKKNSLCDGSSVIDGSVVKPIYQEYSVSRTQQKGYPSPKPVPNRPPFTLY